MRLIGEGAEGPKLDFKRTISLETAAEKAEFCKDLSAIANTDGDHFGGYGFIVLGAEGGKLLGGVTAWQRSADQFSARLTQVAKEYLAPPPEFSFVSFTEADVGDWGVIVIFPSSEQPHIFVRDMAGNPARHEWFVRVNDTTERASVIDYARILSSATRRATRSLEAELQALKLEFKQHAPGQPIPADVATAIVAELRGSSSSSLAEPVEASTADRVKLAVGTKMHRVELALVEDALRVQQVMLADRPENPQRFSSSQAEELQKPLLYMEEHTKSLAEGLAAVVRYDESERLWNAVVEAVDMISEEPSLTGPYWEHAQQLRLYPLVLVIYSLAFVSAGRNDGRLLRRVLDLELRPANREDPEPLICALRRLRATKSLFNTVSGRRLYEPIAERLSSVVPGLCARRVDDGFGRRQVDGIPGGGG